MTETTEFPPLSPATHASVQGLARAKHEVEMWTKNLEQALAEDVAADPPRLTPEQAAVIAKTHKVEAPPKPGDPAEARETTAEANQAQLDAQTKANEALAAKDQKVAAAAQPKDDEPAHPAAPEHAEPPKAAQQHAGHDDKKPEHKAK
jgi:hypothetical protein